VTEIAETPGVVVVNSQVTKSVFGTDDVTLIVSSVSGTEVTQFCKSRDLQEWLTQENYIYLSGSRGVWIKAPKVPTGTNIEGGMSASPEIT
jgi:hypothetical protein